MTKKYANRIVGSGIMNPADIKANPQNWRKHPASQGKALDEVLGSVGWIQEVIINKTTGNLIDGHLRVETALKNKETEIPVKYVELTEDEERIALATFDPISAMAEQDADMLKQLLADIESEDVDMAQFFGEDVLPKIEHTEEELEAVPEVPKVAKTKRGDMYKLGEHVLMCGDSTVEEDVRKLMQEDKAEILFTSPPYDSLREYKGGDLSVSNLSQFVKVYAPHTDYQCVNLGIVRKDYEVYPYWDEYISQAHSAGLKLLAWNVWDKQIVGSIGQQKHMFPIRHEFIFVFGQTPKIINKTVEKKDKASIGKTRMKTQREADGTMHREMRSNTNCLYKPMESVCCITSELGRIREEHPAVFPVALPIEYIKAMTDAGDVVIEPFGGSGSTLIACEETGRKCRMMELAPEYCDVIVERWEKLTGKKAELISGE